MTNSNDETFNATIGNTMLSDVFFKDFEESKKTHSLIQNIESNVIMKAWEKFNDSLRDKLLDKLENLGFNFQFLEDFEYFVKHRITNIQFEQNPTENFLYLDYKDEIEKGILLFNFSTKINSDFKDGILTLTIG